MGLAEKYRESLAETVGISEFINGFKKWIDSSNMLEKRSFRDIETLGNFDSDTWALLDDVTQYHRYIKFSELNADSNTKNIVKCWIASLLQEEGHYSHIGKKCSLITKVINETNDFSIDCIDGKKGNAIITLFNKELDYSKQLLKTTILEYVDFLDSYGLATKGHYKVQMIVSKFNVLRDENNSRTLPSSNEIMGFQFYIKKFFYDEEGLESFKKVYFPILMWWKITNVIPMRPSEFAYKLKRDCIAKENGKFYITIGRLKVGESYKTGQIPIVTKFEITQEIFDMINEYLKMTECDTTSNTLLSYEYLRVFKAEAQIEYQDMNWSKFTINSLNINNPKKQITDCFNRSTLAALLSSFYEVIIKGVYNDSSLKEQITLGDTRHLAFSSLALQGVSPIEIAMLGGHTTLDTQVSYSGHVEYYINSEILDYISKRNLEKEVTDRNLINIIMNKPKVCPEFIANCTATDDNIGYCTIDLKKGEFCDDVSNCVLCSKWWCEPTNENYIKAKKYLETSQIAPLEETIRQEEQFFIELLRNARTVNNEGLLEMEQDYEIEVKQARLNLKASIDKLISLKKSLL